MFLECTKYWKLKGFQHVCKNAFATIVLCQESVHMLYLGEQLNLKSSETVIAELVPGFLGGYKLL